MKSMKPLKQLKLSVPAQETPITSFFSRSMGPERKRDPEISNRLFSIGQSTGLLMRDLSNRAPQISKFQIICREFGFSNSCIWVVTLRDCSSFLAWYSHLACFWPFWFSSGCYLFCSYYKFAISLILPLISLHTLLRTICEGQEGANTNGTTDRSKLAAKSLWIKYEPLVEKAKYDAINPWLVLTGMAFDLLLGMQSWVCLRLVVCKVGSVWVLLGGWAAVCRMLLGFLGSLATVVIAGLCIYSLLVCKYRISF